MFIDNVHAIVRYGSISIHKQLKDLNINGSEHSVMAYLAFHKSVNGDEISEYLRIDKSTASKALSSLEKKGLIIRVTNDHNRREKLVELTPEGTALGEKIDKVISSWTEEVLKNLTLEERDMFNQLCEKVADSIIAINEKEE